MRFEHNVSRDRGCYVHSLVQQNSLQRVRPEIVRADRRKSLQNELDQDQKRLMGVEKQSLGLVQSFK